jgi:hypothetical protein
MPLPESGPLSLQQIADEFGGATPHSLSEYYAGGPYVPPGATGINGPIPSSGQIKISDFYGAGAPAEYALFYVTAGGTGNYTDPGDVFTSGGYHAGWSTVGDEVFDDSRYGEPAAMTVAPWVNNGVELMFGGYYTEDAPTTGASDFMYTGVGRDGISAGDWRYQPSIWFDQTRSGNIWRGGFAGTAASGYYHGNIPVVGGSAARFWYTGLGRPWTSNCWSDLRDGPFRIVVAQSYPFAGTPV